MLKSSHPARGPVIKRRLSIQPAFHETDMMGVVHNSNYFLWFERGRLEIMLEVLPLEEALRLGVFMPVVENVCHYRRAVKFGMRLVLHTSHHLQAAYEGRLVFNHYLMQEKPRTAMAYGHSTMTLLDARANKLVKEWPPEIWQRYQALR
jgi:acyl-CoA thioester hydrolase